MFGYGKPEKFSDKHWYHRHGRVKFKIYEKLDHPFPDNYLKLSIALKLFIRKICLFHLKKMQ